MRTDSHPNNELIESLRAVLVPLIEEIAETLSSSPKPLLTKSDVAKYLAVSVRTVDLLVAEGELIPIRVRSARRFSRDAIDRYLRSKTSSTRK